jgi:hypothetical protein
MTTFSPPRKSPPADRPSFQLRNRAACSLVKRKLLGDRDRPFEAQPKAMAKALGAKFRASTREVSKETWAAWWRGEQAPKEQNQKMLDQAYGKASGFISSLIDGKPFRESPQHSESALHLHFEALDAAGCSGEKADDAGREKLEEKAFRVLRVLHRKWRPNRLGALPDIYPKSGTLVEFEAAQTDTERDAIRARFPDNFKPSLFELALKSPDRLSREVLDTYDVLSPASLGAFLLAVGLDSKFLSEDKIDDWAWDFATASLALFALLYAQPGDFLIARYPSYLSFWDKVHKLFWFEDGDSDSDEDFEYVLQCLGLWESASEEVCYNFCRAREAYKLKLGAYGLNRADVREVFESV